MASGKAPVEPEWEVDYEEKAYTSEIFDAMVREVDRSPCLRRYGGEGYYAYMLRMDRMANQAAALREQAREDWQRTKERLARLQASRFSPYLTNPPNHTLDLGTRRVRMTARMSVRPPRDVFLGRRDEGPSRIHPRDIPESSGFGGKAERGRADEDDEEKVEVEIPMAQQGAGVEDSDSEVEMWEVRKPAPELIVIEDDEEEEDPEEDPEEEEEEPIENEELIEEDPEEDPEEVVANEDSDPESSITDGEEDFDDPDFGFED